MGLNFSRVFRSLPDDPQEGCGHSTLWLTPESDPFMAACVIHDQAYDKAAADRAEGLAPAPRAEVDRAFLESALVLAGSSIWLKCRAYFFYGLVRVVGRWAY